tara:strand:- start:753 stop:1595 length:843 start_codon:yes stop_codon:yes gene_type:complete
VPAPRPKRISDILPKLQNVAQTSNFLVKFVLPNGELKSHMRRKGLNDRFVIEDAGLFCYNAVLPGSALASVNTVGDYQGMVERFVHTRNFTQVNFEFYVDNEYKSLKFLEHWMEFITGSNSNDVSADTYYFQLNYPDSYKSNDTRVIKFERNYSQFLEYRFVGLFPLTLNSTRVQYGNSQILKATASFSYDRYICGESSSLARDLGRAFNDLRSAINPSKDGAVSYGDNDRLNNIMRMSSKSGGVLNSDVAKLRTSVTGNVTSVANAAGQGLPGAGQIIS